ncbi:MAG: exodeoxyribonuclease V subunit beta [Gracilimonas sp.]|uniref:exodeoxyribonuclease V subunit beta n=1 Tax=Gracilimonas sp. TaxID=1974203 RepID=UPI001B26D6C6|nr:exodeoxyribonuclease V subunit beta [Gracilimonas sp.]MBO6586516.1 exodeoxyribonuclease V subunit beta [Gracilimonas sp.]MBO6615173.1 exodeoxyribonuclease V subunit beta [Gracilimonas sp.]
MSKPLAVFEAPLKGISLVEASAGTGKTYNITSLYVRAILEKGLEPSQILVMTYTEAATAELKFRLRSRLKESLQAIKSNEAGNDGFLENLISQGYDDAEAKLKSAIDRFDEAAVFTIHGFCSRLLTEYSLQFGVPPNLELLTDQSEVLQDCVDDYWRSFIRGAETDSNDLLLLDYLTDEGFGPDELKSVVDEIMNQPNSEVIPANYNLERLYSLVDRLREKFEEVQVLWEDEGKALEEIYRGDDLNRGIYRKSTEESDWLILREWLNNDNAKIWYSDRLEKFGRKISRSGKKSAPDIPELNISRAIDEYMEIADRLKMLKIAFIQESIGQIKADFEKQKENSNLLTYSDLLELAEKGLSADSSGKLAKRLSIKYPLALVDEFQDTDPIQYSIFKQIYYKRVDAALFMIGDPKQAIYGFRGADIFTYLEAKKDSDDAQSYTLSENHRSNSRMIEGVNELFGQSASPFLIDGFSFKPAHFPSQKEDSPYLKRKSAGAVTPLQAITLDGDEYSSKGTLEEDIYTAVCNEVKELLSGEYTLNGREVEEKDIAILIRKGFQGEKIQQMLREKGLKSVLKSRTSVFLTREADELLLVLKSTQEISNEQGIRAALSTELLGYTAGDIYSLLQDEQKWAKIIQQFVQLKEIWDNQGIEAALERLLQEFGVLGRLSVFKDAERRITNLMHLSELLGQAQREQRVQGKALLKWYHQKQQKSSADSDDEQLRLESDEDLIQISTIHSSKGLQYPIVLCPFLWDSGADVKSTDILKFHRDGVNYIDISQGISHSEREQYEALTVEQQMAEEVRLTYVALTRSVASSFVFIPNYKKIDQSPLSSILNGKNESDSRSFDSLLSILNKCDHIEVRDPVGGKSAKRDQKSETVSTLKSAQFRRKDMYRYPKMLSYSSLMEGKSHTDSAHDYDELFYQFENKAPLTHDKFGFPRGANAGTFLHKIFEDISFNSPKNLEQVIIDNLNYYGFEEIWKTPVQQWVEDTLAMELGNPPVSLSTLNDTDVLKEMEFYFPVQNLQVIEIWEMIRGEKPGSADIDQASGFIKGFIDLIFRSGDRYYILDYKSNHLGDTPADYSSENLSQAIIDSGYDLQYHIYSLALHRFLRKRVVHYDYEQHFGGVLYLFLRGVDKDKPGSGVFFHRPDSELISQLGHYFEQGGHQ